LSRLALLLLALVVAGCVPRGAPVQSSPHYVVGEPYQAGGIWRYPREQFTYIDAGLAVVADRVAGLTADGEAFDQGVLAAAHRTLQLPALARVTNLENGRAVLYDVELQRLAEALGWSGDPRDLLKDVDDVAAC